MARMSLRDSFLSDDERWTENVLVDHELPVENTDGYAIRPDDSQAEYIDAIVRPQRARRFERLESGLSTEAEYFLICKNEDDVDQGEYIGYDGEWYEARQAKVDFFNDFAVYQLEGVDRDKSVEDVAAETGAEE